MKLFKALNNKMNAFKELTQHIKTAILLPANPTALLRPAQSVKDTGHALHTQAAFKLSCQRLPQAKSWLGYSWGTTLSGTTAHKGYGWKVNYSLPVFCRMSEI